VEIVGVSFDSPEENQSWALEEGFQFELWSDDDRELALYYGAAASAGALAASRITMLLDDGGAQLLEYTESINVGTHPAQVLADCQELFGP
jgi:peroxiredoxin Q/BCP